MKFTIKQKMRLAELSNSATLTDAEKTELTELTDACKAAGLTPATVVKEFTEADDDAEEGISEEKLAALITKAVTAAIPANSGVDSAKLIAEIQKAAASQKGEGLTADQVEKIMIKHIGGTSIDKDALVLAIKAAMPEEKGVTQKELLATLDKFAASIKTPSRNEFEVEYARDFPFEHRNQNMTVAEKQLANVCLHHVSDERKADMKAAKQHVPTGMNDGISDEQLAYAARKGAAAWKAARNARIYGGKTLTTTGSGSGADLIPSDLSSDLMMRMYLESQLASEMQASEIEMPTPVFKFPLTTTRPNFYVGSENPGSDPTSSEPGTDSITLDSKKLIGMSEYSYEADEDAIIAILPMLQESLAAGAADAYEGALINGDTTGTHQDSDIHAVSGHHAKLFKGLRKYAIAGSLTKDISTGKINATNIIAMRKMLKRWGVKPRDLMLLVGPQGYNDLIGLEETLTFEKVGNPAAARILTGEAGSIMGIRIVVSAQVREDLNASGVYDGTTMTKGSVLLVHRPSWISGVRRGFTVEVDVDRKRQVNSVVASFRRAFVPKETPSTTLPSVVLGYNYAV